MSIDPMKKTVLCIYCLESYFFLCHICRPFDILLHVLSSRVDFLWVHQTNFCKILQHFEAEPEQNNFTLVIDSKRVEVTEVTTVMVFKHHYNEMCKLISNI